MQPYRRLAVMVSCSGLLVALLTACSTVPQGPAATHLRSPDAAPAGSDIPAPVMASANIPKPRAANKTETYSVVVNNIKVQELLFALARDAKLNIDIYPGIQGTVTLNAIDQTLQQLLARISKQVDIRWELDGPNLAVMPDTPFLRTYKVDYVNMSRDASATISANSQITSGIAGSSGSGGAGGGTSGGAMGGGAAGNVSITRVENKVSHHFWESLERNIKDLLRETDKILPAGSSETVVERSDQQSTSGTGATAAGGRRSAATPGIAGSPNPAVMQQDETTVTRRTTFREAASVIINAETGIVTVRATGRQHEKIQEFIDQVSTSARRQVMIEATIVEVELSDAYQQGIDWSRTGSDGSIFRMTSPTTTNTLNQSNPFVLSYVKPLDINVTLSLLEQFGNVKVLSSPRLSVLNNQSALLKVVENKVYFTVKADVASATVSGAQPTKAVTTTPQSVSVGLVMTVTPQISESSSITLNVRPSITSISNYVIDPSPELTQTDDSGKKVVNKIPEIRTREMESMMRVEDGEIAVLGGLMQERTEYNSGRVPGVGAVPFFGELFTNRNNLVSKSELVIFLRPVVIRDPSVSGDYRKLRGSLPDDKFFTPPPRGVPFGVSGNPAVEQP
jgi:general secretion pathway protein D